MSRYRATAAVTGLLMLTAGLAAPALATDDPCLDPAALQAQRDFSVPYPIVVPTMPYVMPRPIDRHSWPVATYDLVTQGTVALHVGDPGCTGVTVTVRTPTGAERRIALTKYWPDQGFQGHYGDLTARIGDGGQWHFTAMQRGTTTLTLSPPKPFQVWMQSVVLLDHIATVPAGRPVVVSGTVYVYTVDQVPVRSRNRSVVLSSTNLSGGDWRGVASLVTDAAGRFSATVTAGASRYYVAQLPQREPSSGDIDITTSYVGGTGVQLGTALQVPAYRVATSVTGRATPGGRTVVLESDTPDTDFEWHPVASAVAAADGRFAISYRPSWTGPMRMRVRLSGTTIADEFETVTVHRSSLTARSGPTTAPEIRPGTKLSTYGHLRVTYDNGTSGAYPNQRVVVQTRVQGVPGATFATVATARTTATGYYYANWTAREDVDVRVAYLSPFPTVAWSFSPNRTIDVI